MSIFSIRFSNYKKVYIILGIFVFLIGVLYIASVVYSRKTKTENINSVNRQLTGGTSSNQGIATDDLETSGITRVRQNLMKEASLLIQYLTKDSSDKLKSYFQDTDKGLIERVSNNLKWYQLPVRTEFVEVNVNPDGRQGNVLVRVIGGDGVKGDYLEFVYRVNESDQWQLTNVIIHRAE